MGDEAEFNTYAAEAFIAEYQLEMGQLHRFARMGDPFPDVWLEAPDGTEVGVEFVSVVLAFVNQEHRYFDRYRRAFLTAIQNQRPRFRNVTITLQPHREHVERVRPMQLPDISGPDGRALVADFARLLIDRFEELSAAWGGNHGGALLDQLRNTDGTLCYPSLSGHFGAILFHKVTSEDVPPSAMLSDEPFIADPVIWYENMERVAAVRKALDTKVAKGSAYSSDLLVVHTLPKPDVADVSGIAMQAEELIEFGRELLAATPELTRRFREIWFLNRYITNGKRLYRLG
jgi:hypothetical protein